MECTVDDNRLSRHLDRESWLSVLSSGSFLERIQSRLPPRKPADANDIARYEPISPRADSIRHAGLTGDSGEYPDHEVERMAQDVTVKKQSG